MGRVWRAADEMLDRPVAVKEMRIDGLDAEDARTRRERTLREARATARIDHPHVVRVYDVVDEGERLWIVMELVAGRSLERIMAEDGPLGPGEAARIGLGLVEALREVHARGVLHRDIKPGNVLVEAAGRRVVLTDFGIAAIQDAKALTMAGMLVGSPDYMAPERISGRPQGPPSDVWSLGATLSAALAGQSPFSRDTTLATLHAVLYEEPELPPSAGPLAEVLGALLRKEPEVRPGLDALEAALREVAPGPTPTLVVAEPVPSREPAPASAEPPPSDRTRPAGGVSLARSQAVTERRPASGAAGAPPGGEPPGPAMPSGPPGRRTTRTAVAAAAGVLTAAVVAGIVWATTARAPDGTRADGRPSVSAPAGSSGTGAADPSDAASPSPTVAGTSRPPSPAPGARVEAGGYAWVTPEGWRRDVKTGAEVHYTAPEGTQELVAKSSLARGDLMDSWRTSERNAHQGRDYRKIRLEQTTFRGHPAVVWEYTFTLEGVPWHARLLGFDARGKSYQINTWYQPAVEDGALAVYEDVKKSFTPL
ncbi:protein kinase [Streptomyces sp. NPDC089424]|uniref:protein kinase domain-containing protein n=1 Tax=Streptomyces sp. NPDC089424 TaxID=3365917 RepID=UPI00382E5382